MGFLVAFGILFAMQYGALLLFRLVFRNSPKGERSVLALALLPILFGLVAFWIYVDPTSCSPDDADMCPRSFAAEMILVILTVASTIAGLVVFGIERHLSSK